MTSNDWGGDKPGTRIFAEGGHEEPSIPRWNAREDERWPVEPGALRKHIQMDAIPGARRKPPWATEQNR